MRKGFDQFVHGALIACFCSCLCLCTQAKGESLSTSKERIQCEHAKVNTEDATPVDPGTIEVELGYGMVYAGDAFNDERENVDRELLREHGCALVLTVGVVENLDIGVEQGYVDLHDEEEFVEDGEGLGDLGVGFKWRFFAEEDDGDALDIAWVGGLVVPWGRDGAQDRLAVTQDFWSTDQSLVMSQDWDETTVNGALTVSVPLEDVEGYDATLAADFAMGYHVTQCLQPELEINYAHDFQTGEDSDSVGITAGLIACLPAGFRIDAGVQQIVAGKNVDESTSVSVALVYAR